MLLVNFVEVPSLLGSWVVFRSWLVMLWCAVVSTAKDLLAKSEWVCSAKSLALARDGWLWGWSSEPSGCEQFCTLGWCSKASSRFTTSFWEIKCP